MNLVKCLRIGAFGISVTSPAASASPSGAGPSRRIRLLSRSIQNWLVKHAIMILHVFQVSLDEFQKILCLLYHRRCLPAMGVRSSVKNRKDLDLSFSVSWVFLVQKRLREVSAACLLDKKSCPVVFPPISTGLECGSLAENKTCDNGDCPVDCALSEWGLFLSFHITKHIKITIIILIAIINHPQSSLLFIL